MSGQRPSIASGPARTILATLVAAACVAPPVYLLLRASAGPWPAPRLLPESLRLDRWAAVVGGEAGLAGSLWLSIAISLSVATVATALGFVSSKHLVAHPRRRLWLLLAYLPFSVSPVILAVCMMWLFIKLGLSGTAIGVAVAQTTLAYGFAVVFFAGAWNEHVRGLEAVARTLGASRRQVYLRVLLPAMRPLILVCFFQTFLISWVQYGLTLMIGSGTVRTLPLRVFDSVFEADPAFAALASTLLVLPPIALLWIKRRVLFKAI